MDQIWGHRKGQQVSKEEGSGIIRKRFLHKTLYNTKVLFLFVFQILLGTLIVLLLDQCQGEQVLFAHITFYVRIKETKKLFCLVSPSSTMAKRKAIIRLRPFTKPFLKQVVYFYDNTFPKQGALNFLKLQCDSKKYVNMSCNIEFKLFEQTINGLFNQTIQEERYSQQHN